MVELLSAIFNFIRNIFASPSVTVNVNVDANKKILETLPTPSSLPPVAQNPTSPVQKLEPLPLPTRTLRTDTATLSRIDTGMVNPIDEEAISDLLAALKYSKQPGDEIVVRIGKSRINPDDI